MKKSLKKIGRFFVALNQKYEKDIRQSILLIDGNSILPNNLALIIRDVKNKFKNANLVVLTFGDKKEFIRDNFPDVEIIIPKDKVGIERYRLAIKLSFLLRRNLTFLILSSLDISPLLVSLLLARFPIFLHNRWLEWYRIRLRNVSDVLHGVTSIDTNRRRKNRCLKDFFKSFGRIFVVLCRLDEAHIKSRILISDNGYTDIGHVSTAVRRAAENFVNPDITILTFPARRHYFVDMFPQAKVITVEADRICALAQQMYHLRKERFNYVVLTTLDISSILISFLSIKARVLLYNQWHEWWALNFRDIRGYLKEALKFIIMIPVFVYLLIVTAFILLKTGLRLKLRFQWKSKVKNEYEPI